MLTADIRLRNPLVQDNDPNQYLLDIGTLISAGTGKELFHLSQENVLRVYVNVPQVYSTACVPGLPATLTLPQFPGRTFEGRIVRTAKAIDPASRTLLVEVDVKNPTGELYPGASVRLEYLHPTRVVERV